MKMMLRAVRPRLRVLWTRHWTGVGKNLPWAWKERPILNLSCLLLQFKKAYLLSAPPGRLRRGLEDPEESANKSKELSFGLTFMMRARAKEWQKIWWWNHSIFRRQTLQTMMPWTQVASQKSLFSTMKLFASMLWDTEDTVFESHSKIITALRFF